MIKTNTFQYKFSVLCFDELQIKKIYDSDMKTQKISGSHSKVQVVMMRGLVEKWKQPIWFHFATTMTKKLLDDIIIKIESNGFEIRAIVCDLWNHTLRSELGIDK
ncbi:unnamed protein product [Lepeophtheirus salmonis]|uniref:(salmon louse) hypothetical protein n=1 Tax=Lepeophtheirus salmonis TaxID=72036 RepID=A0A7R8CGA1_LEPSM|nr:unnamed protein product [Lepeophtheirus salmonis]CAF2814690.1 unnamed protein product [Lepeophtheirus salmonis]